MLISAGRGLVSSITKPRTRHRCLCYAFLLPFHAAPPYDHLLICLIKLEDSKYLLDQDAELEQEDPRQENNALKYSGEIGTSITATPVTTMPSILKCSDHLRPLVPRASSTSCLTISRLLYR